jgi:hypothetical protein
LAQNVKIIDGKKFMWDGINYESEYAAKENVDKYSKEGFETKLIEEEGKYFIYSRRVAAEIKLESHPK